MIIAVDFDGTIVDHKYPHIGQEKTGAFDALRKLSRDGHKLILWTVREGKLLEEAVAFCQSNGVEFYAVNSDQPGDNLANVAQSRKVRADLFIDDSNLGGIPDWSMIYSMISEHLTFGDVFSKTMGLEDEYASSSTHSSHKHRRRRKRCFLGRLIDRCRSSRSKFNGGGSSFHRHW